MNIAIAYYFPFGEFLFVRRKDEYCQCDIDDCAPQVCANLPNDSLDNHVCQRCSGIVTYHKNDLINRMFGFSGYDEVHE